MKRYLVCSFLALGFWACDSSGSKKSGQVDPAIPVEEKALISLGGTIQYVEMTGASDKNPVLLFIHGGPG